MGRLIKISSMITGTYQCTKCDHTFNWHFKVPQLLSSNIVATTSPSNSRGAKIIKEVGDKTYLFQTRCPKCSELLDFEEKVEEKISHF